MASTLYIKLVRRAHRFLRGKLMRRFPWVAKLLKPLFRREYWVASPHRMSLGISIGLFFAFAFMIIPIQMILAALTCLYLKANLPLSLGGCWITNPFTVPIFGGAAVWLGGKLAKMGMPLGDQSNMIPFTEIEVNWGHFIAGSVLIGVVLALVAYPLVYLLTTSISKKKKA